MDFRSRYQRELDHLLLAGKSFARVHSQARHLAERSGDPDVERLLEGFAFLSAKVKARIDAGAPDLIHSLTELLAPAQLRPIPSCTILEFKSDPSRCRASVDIPMHTEICSEDVQGIPIRFRITQNLTLLPMTIEHTRMQDCGAGACIVEFTVQGERSLANQVSELGHLDLYIHGSCEQASDLYYAIVSHCHRIEIHGQNTKIELCSPSMQSLGQRLDTPLFPWPVQAWQGQRILAEYFTLPEKFRQIRISDLGHVTKLAPNQRLTFKLFLDISAKTLGPLTNDPIKLHCVPAINLFECDAEPITQNELSVPQRIRATGHDLDQFELYEVKKVTRSLFGQDRRDELPSLFSHFRPPKGPAYVIERRPSSIDQRSDSYLRIVDPGPHKGAQRELMSMELLCSHRQLASKLRLGQINRFSTPVATHIEVCDLRVPTVSSPAPLHDNLQWQLFSLIGAARCARPSKAQLDRLLQAYNHQARVQSAQGQANQQLHDAIVDVTSRSFTGLVRGVPTRGRESTVELQERNLSVGQAFLFGQVLHELLSDTTALHTLHRSRLRLHPSGKTMTLCARGCAHPRLQ